MGRTIRAALSAAQLDRLRARIRVANSISVDCGRSWGPRTICDWEHVLVLSGGLQYECGASVYDLVGGDILSIPPERPHLLRTTESGEIGCIHVDYFAPCPEDGTGAIERVVGEVFPPVVRDAERIEAGAHFLRVVEAYEGVDPYRVPLLATLGAALAVQLTRLAADPRRITARTERMLRYIREHAKRVVPRAELATRFGITEQYLNAIFRREVGMTPTQYRHRTLMHEAHHLLAHDGLQVNEVAAELGYYDPFHFSHAFKRHFGYAPSRLLGRE